MFKRDFYDVILQFSLFETGKSSVKVKTLLCCVNAALDSVEIRAFTEKHKKESSDEEFCRHCQTKGNLVLCDSCPAGYHAVCAKLEEGKVEKMDSWECPVCVQNKVNF